MGMRMQTAMTWEELGALLVSLNILVYAGEVALLLGAAFGAASSMTARERAGRRLVAWEPIVCGIGGAVLATIATLAVMAYLLDLSWPVVDALSWYVFFAAGQGALIGLWVALYRTVGNVHAGPASKRRSPGNQRSIAAREP